MSTNDTNENTNFWQRLNRPFFVLAPMADVTDAAFRQIIAKYGKPDIFYTEFVSADGLCSAGKEKLLVDLKFSKNEHPIVAQIFGSNPENIRNAAMLCKELGFDGIDINMGCPDRSVEKQGAGAAHLKNPKLAREVIRAAIEGVEGLPVSVKTRLGYNKIEIDSWLPELLSENISALVVHLRTRKEMSKVPAHWELMPQIVGLRNKINKNTLIIGNGDVLDTADARRKCEATGCDGAMLGRTIFGNPWLFATPSDSSLSRGGQEGLIKEKLRVMLEHTELFEDLFISNRFRQGFGGPSKNFAIMKKHYKAYVNGFDGANELRMQLMEAINAEEVEKIVNDFLSKLR